MWIVSHTSRQTVVYLFNTTLISVDLAQYGIVDLAQNGISRANVCDIWQGGINPEYLTDCNVLEYWDT